MDLPDTVLMGDNRSYFLFGHGEHLLQPKCQLDMHSFKSIQQHFKNNLFNNIQLLEKSFNTEEQCQNMNFNKLKGTTAIIYDTI